MPDLEELDDSPPPPEPRFVERAPDGPDALPSGGDGASSGNVVGVASSPHGLDMGKRLTLSDELRRLGSGRDGDRSPASGHDRDRDGVDWWVDEPSTSRSADARSGAGGGDPSSGKRYSGSVDEDDDGMIVIHGGGGRRDGDGDAWTPHETTKKPRPPREGRTGTGIAGVVGEDDVGADALDAQMDAWLRRTVDAMPVKPDHISGVRRPLMNVSQVDDTTVDVTMTTSFRAHFSQPISSFANANDARRGTRALPPAEGDGGGVLGEGAVVAVGGSNGMVPGSSGRFGIASPDDYVGGKGGGESGGGARGGYMELPDIEPTVSLGAAKEEEAEANALVSAKDVALDNAVREWEVRPSELRLRERLAVGGFAEVFRGTWNGTTVAVKQLLQRGPDVVARLREEVHVLSRLRHPNLLLFMGWCPEPPLIATEFMKRGSLHNILRKNKGPLDGPRMHHCALSVARGMHYLHSRSPPILHLDLKSPNILVDDKWRVKIADFGLARVRSNTLLSGNSAFHGTPEWMAPEMLRAENYDEKADVYSYGVVLWELLAAQTPWNELHPMQVVAVVGYSERRLALTPDAEATARSDPATAVIGDLFHACASKLATERPLFAEVLDRLERVLTLMLPGPSATGTDATGAGAGAGAPARGGARGAGSRESESGGGARRARGGGGLADGHEGGGRRTGRGGTWRRETGVRRHRARGRIE
jgi:hypothetical protein